MDIIIDTKGNADLVTKDRLIESDDDDIDFDNTAESKGTKFFDIEENLFEDDNALKKTRRDANKDIDLEEFEKEMGWTGSKSMKRKIKKKDIIKKDIVSFVDDEKEIDKILKKSVIKPGIEQQEAVPANEVGKRKLRELKRKEREKTTGKDWFNMKPPEMTPEIKRDLEILKMRAALDPKHFYKKNDLKVIPKYFQIGKVVDSPAEYYSSRLTKKERKKTIVDELMADAQFAKYNKRKYKEIIDEKKKRTHRAHKHAKRLKGKRK